MGKIDSVFEYAKKNQVTFIDQEKKPYKVNNSHQTWNTYRDTMKTYEKWLQDTHGLKDITRAKARHATAYMEQMISEGKSAFTISKFPHALHALQQLARPSGVFRGLKLGRKEDLIKLKTEAGVIRKSSESKALKANEADFEKVQAEILASKSPRKHEIAEIHQIQKGVGCRIHEAVKMQGHDVKFNDYGHADVYIKGKAGQERWVEVRDVATLSLLKSKMEGKKDGADLFPLTNRKGDQKGRKDAIKQVQKVVAAAAIRAGVGGSDGQTYNTHSARKVFAQNRVDHYAKMSYSQLKKEMARRINKFPLDENGKNRLKSKVDNELGIIRKKIRLEIPGKRTAAEGHELRKERDFNHKELSLLLTSVDTGHFRISIMRYYCDYKPSEN